MITETKETVQATNLRIGNILSYGETEKIFVRVESITATDINGRFIEDEDAAAEGRDVDPHYESYLLADLNPVLITPEILAKCGFEKVDTVGENEYYRFRDIGVIYFDGACEFCFIESDEWDNFKDFYSLHQFQNVYSAMTDEELEINL